MRRQIRHNLAVAASVLAVAGISYGFYAGAWRTADAAVMLAAVIAILIRRDKPGRLPFATTFRHPGPWILAPVFLSAAWSADPADTLFLGWRLLAIFLIVPLPWPKARYLFPFMFAAMPLVALAQLGGDRPAALSTNAVTASELGLFGLMTGSAWMAWLSAPLLGATLSRASIGSAVVFAALAGRRSLAAVVVVAICIFGLSTALSGAWSRLAGEDLSQGMSDRAAIAVGEPGSQGAALVDIYGLEPERRPEPGTAGRWWWDVTRSQPLRSLTGVGAGAYAEAFGAQRPHSVPVLVWRELGLFGIPVLIGLAMLLRRAGLAISAALVLNFTIASESVAADPAVTYSAAMLAAWLAGSKLGRNSAYIPKQVGRFYRKRFGILSRIASTSPGLMP